jgi:acetyltransferase-like isoleucine patch superfamily enzyme
VSIGDRCRLGIGSVVTRSLPEDTQGLGNPFQERRFDLK